MEAQHRGGRSLKNGEEEGREQMLGGAYHRPVLLREAIDWLVTDPTGIYVDGTIGGGGHAAAILQRLKPPGKLYGFDLDEDAISYCQRRFQDAIQKGQLILIHDSYRKACSIKEDREPPFLSGLLLDLGASSHQFDVGRRGWSYRVDARLDMRFGSTGPTAEDLLASLSEKELAEIFWRYGEEPLSRKIAHAIVRRRVHQPIRTTFQLRDLVEQLVPPHRRRKVLSRIFQALRIAVNEELTVLEETLRCIVPLLRSGGRIVVISYHSLEDRIVKTVFRELSRRTEAGGSEQGIEKKRSTPVLRILTKKPIRPSPEEVAQNPRARSAKLRVAEKIEQEPIESEREFSE